MAHDPDFAYVGSELELFARAVNWKAYFADQLGAFISGRVLEVGAGIGATMRVLCNERVDAWTCLEPDKQLATQLTKAISQGRRYPASEVEVVVGSIADVPEHQKYDTILYIDVLEHIENDREELRLAASRLAVDGRLIVLAPAHQWLYTPFDSAIGHFRRYSRRRLQDVAPEELQLVRLRYLDSVGLLASAANRLFLQSSQPTRLQINTWDKAMVPLSRFVDRVLVYRAGKSVVGVWRRQADERK